MRRKTLRRPEIWANFATTLDGKIATRENTPSLFTSPADKARLLEIRSRCQAILAGRHTVEADQMSMTVPIALLKNTGRQPLRVIFSASGGISPHLKVFQTDVSPVVIFCQSPPAHRKKFPDFVIWRQLTEPRLAPALEILHAEFGIRRAVCEGGATLFRSFIEEDLIDRLFLTIAPTVFGGQTAPTLTGEPKAFLSQDRDWQLRRMNTKDGECFLQYQIIR